MGTIIKKYIMAKAAASKDHHWTNFLKNLDFY